jgi:ABC-type transport system substrate-binding protein/DNA-binding SARP family transcriptional activator/DNA-binding beta-propeller fold protein YncE
MPLDVLDQRFTRTSTGSRVAGKVDLRLLGPVEARLDDQPIGLGPRKQRAVLAMLALESGRTVSADRLAEGLWGDAPPSSAAKMVQLYVSHLRRLLDGNGVRIVTRGRGYELQLSDGDVDTLRFERLLEESRPREALALWRGEALCDVADEPFAASEIRRLEGLRLQAVEHAIDDDLAAGRHVNVIGELEALVAAEPLRERLHAQRMLALYRSGRQSDALAAYRDARTELVEQIGVEPGAELRRLQDAILSQDPALDVAEAPGPEPPASPAQPPRRLSMLLLVTAAVLVLAGVTAYGVIRVLEPDGLAAIGENSVGRIDPDSGLITERYPVGRSPSAVVGGGGSVWIANAAEGTVSRIDRGGDQPMKVIPVDGAPAALAFGGGSLWVADSDSRFVAQVDPGANKVVQKFEVGNAPRALAATAGAVWVASGVDGRVQRIDLDRGRVTPPIRVGGNPSAIAAGAGALWVASEEAGTVTRVEPRTGSVLPPIRVGNGPSALAVGEGAVWVVNRHDGTLSRIEPATNKVSWTGSVGSDPTAVAAGEGSVWVAGGEEGLVRRVEPSGAHAVMKIEARSSPAAIAVAGGSVWTAADAPLTAHRGGTLRALMPHEAGYLSPMDWLHFHGYLTGPQLNSLAYDGLVAYRRVEGPAGATVVGALATDAPAPSDAGRTYAFTLRPGLRFSDGTPVRPIDVRASIERALQVTRSQPQGEQVPTYLGGIVGARRCSTGQAPCRLTRGIETARSARTVTVHLTRPDPDFLYKLATAPGYVVPAGTARRASTGPTPPGTGPYRVASWDASRGGTLVRNRYFRSTPARPLGPGFADRIEVRTYDVGKTERQIAAVQRGAADTTVVANRFFTTLPPSRIRALAAESPSRLHSRPSQVTNWLFLNVRRRPFDDIRVRRAVNLAIDRDRVVQLTGGPEVGTPSCQFVPPGFPGYAPYCPYTAGAAAGKGWTAPDMEHARRLVQASGRAGERVVIHLGGEPALGRYYERVLDRLGFRTTLRIQSADELDIYEPNTPASTGLTGWAADYLAPSGFIQDNFGCAGGGNLSRLCDRRLDRKIERAAAAPQTDVAAWAAAERRAVDLAPAVPLSYRRSAVLLSDRAGNARTHLLYWTLLDQMWVR